MHVPTKIVQAIVAALRRSLERDRRVRAASVLTATAIDEQIREIDEGAIEDARLIRSLEELIEHDPHAARTPLPAPPPSPPPGMVAAPRLTPPPRKKR